MKSIGLVSILITYFNEKELLIRCLQSINEQSLLPYEVIIYDDASEIGVKKYIDEKLYNFNIQIITAKENKGPAYGRNRLIEIAKGEYLRFQDADDELFENALLEIEKAINISKADIILNEVASYNEKGGLISEKVIGLSEDIDDIFDFSLIHALLTPSITYKRKTAALIDGFKERDVLPQAEDTDFNRRFFLETNDFHLINKPLVKQNIRFGSHSNQNFLDVWKSNLKSLLDLKSRIKHRHIPTYAEALLMTGIKLFNQKDYTMAKIAFKEYRKTGQANYSQYHPLKKKLAQIFGPLVTEYFSVIYRIYIPKKLRKSINRL